MALCLFEYNHPDGGIFDDTHVIFKELSEDEWSSLLSHMERRKFPPGVTLLERSDSDRTLYMVASGSVAVFVTRNGHEHELGIISEGSVFGEMAFLDGRPRSAVVRSRENVEVLSLSYESFESLMSWEPRLACKLLLDVGRVMSHRLRQSQADI